MKDGRTCIMKGQKQAIGWELYRRDWQGDGKSAFIWYFWKKNEFPFPCCQDMGFNLWESYAADVTIPSLVRSP